MSKLLVIISPFSSREVLLLIDIWIMGANPAQKVFSLFAAIRYFVTSSHSRRSLNRYIDELSTFSRNFTFWHWLTDSFRHSKASKTHPFWLSAGSKRTVNQFQNNRSWVSLVIQCYQWLCDWAFIVNFKQSRLKKFCPYLKLFRSKTFIWVQNDHNRPKLILN